MILLQVEHRELDRCLCNKFVHRDTFQVTVLQGRQRDMSGNSVTTGRQRNLTGDFVTNGYTARLFRGRCYKWVHGETCQVILLQLVYRET